MAKVYENVVVEVQGQSIQVENGDTVLAVYQNAPGTLTVVRLLKADSKGRQFIDMRQFWIPEDSPAWVPTRQGAKIPATKLADVVFSMPKDSMSVAG